MGRFALRHPLIPFISYSQFWRQVPTSFAILTSFPTTPKMKVLSTFSSATPVGCVCIALTIRPWTGVRVSGAAWDTALAAGPSPPGCISFAEGVVRIARTFRLCNHDIPCMLCVSSPDLGRWRIWSPHSMTATCLRAAVELLGLQRRPPCPLKPSACMQQVLASLHV